jgi:hypothetical protein
MARLFKTLALFGMLFCFTLGAFAVSFAAHDSWPLPTIELPRVLSHGHAQFTQYPLRFRFETDTGEILNSRQPDLAESRVTHTQVAEPVHAPLVARLYTPKVSLQILELVLLL